MDPIFLIKRNSSFHRILRRISKGTTISQSQLSLCGDFLKIHRQRHRIPEIQNRFDPERCAM